LSCVSRPQDKTMWLVWCLSWDTRQDHKTRPCDLSWYMVTCDLSYTQDKTTRQDVTCHHVTWYTRQDQETRHKTHNLQDIHIPRKSHRSSPTTTRVNISPQCAWKVKECICIIVTCARHDRSLLQKSPIKENVFCKRDLWTCLLVYGVATRRKHHRHMCAPW